MKFVKANPLAAAIALCSLSQTIIAQEEAQEDADSEAIEEVVVEGSLRSLPGEDVEIFGFGKSLLETPRSASTISTEQMERFNVVDIDELVAFAPGTFTQSFFGVAGSLDVRGTPGETYFRGVKRLDNPGNYPTPIGASDRIDIIRGPASPIYGPSKIGGYLNFNPKSARAEGGAFLDSVEGEVSYTGGSWDKNIISAEVGGPLIDEKLGYYLYAELEDSGSFYDNTDTEQTILQASFDLDVSDKLQFQFGGMYHEYEGNQVAGWNRLTQELVDDGTYLTGDAQPLDTDGDGFISHQEYFAAADFTPALDRIEDDGSITTGDGDGEFGVNVFVFRPEFVTVNDLDSLHALDPTTVGTTTLKRNQVLVAEDDTLENETTTLYFDTIYTTDSGLEVKNQMFYEAYENLNENAYGFSQFHDTWVFENKLVFSYEMESDSLSSSFQLSPSVRYTDFEHGDDFTNEYFNRRDLTGPSTSLDARLLSTRIDDDYTEYYEGDYLDLGLAFLADLNFKSGLNIMAGVRYDQIDMESSIPTDKVLLGNFTSGYVTLTTDGLYLFDDFVDPDNYNPEEAFTPTSVSNTLDGVSWTLSINYDSPIGLIPYITASEQTTIIAGQGAELQTANVWSGAAMDSSELLEAGVKGSFLDDSLYFAVALYEQERTDFSAQAIVTNSADKTEGVEAELRWVVNESLILTGGYSHIEVVNLNTLENGGRFSFYGADDVPQIDPALMYGGVVTGIPAAESESDARKAGIPENVYSFTATYDFQNGFAINGSYISVDSTFSGHSQAVELPAYQLVNAGIAYATDNWQVNVTVKNLTDEEYFRANFPNLFGSQIVLPELGRHYQATVSYKF